MATDSLRMLLCSGMIDRGVSSGVTYQGTEVERTGEGDIFTFRYKGKKEDIADLMDRFYHGYPTDFGKLASSKMYQDEGPNWVCELRFESAEGWSTNSPPTTAYGKKSCELECGMISNELSAHPQYRTKWDHFLGAKNGTGNVPAWWDSANTTQINSSDAERYKWVSSAEYLPDGWYVLKTPTKPGVTSWDTATTCVRESVRCRNATAAGKVIRGIINKRGTPSNTFGITGGDWKCDSIRVYWHEHYWIAQCLWTKSVDGFSWDKDLYGQVSD